MSRQESEGINEQDERPENNSELLEENEEHKRLGGYPPLETIGRLLPGLLISQLLTSVDGLANSMWTTMFVGEIGLTTMSQAYIFENIVIAFDQFANTACNTKISYLFSHHNYDSANQVICDVIRFCLILGIIIPAVFIPSAKPILSWFGSDENVLQKSFIYTIPLLSCSFTSMLYYISCGLIQAEGRSWTYSILQITSLILSTCIFDPLFLSQMKHAVGGALSLVAAEGLPGIVLIILIFMHKFSCKPTLKLLLNKFDHESRGAILTGLSALAMNLSIAIPIIFIQKFVAISANNIGSYNTVMAIFNAETRLLLVVTCVPTAMNAAYLPSCSYAFGKKNYLRILWLTFHAAWIVALWGAIITLIISIFPKQVARIWSSDPDFIYWSGKILPICFYTIILPSLKYIFISYLQSIQRSALAIVISIITELIPLPCFSAILHYTGPKNDPVRIFYAYILNDILSTIICLIATVPSMIKFYKKHKEETNSGSIEVHPEL